MITSAWWRTQGGKFPLTAVHSASEPVEAYIYGNKLYCDFDDLGSAETIIITTPFALKIKDARLRIKNGKQQATKTLTISTTGDLSNAMSMATDKSVIRATTMDTTYENVAVDGTITFTSSAHGDADALVVLDIEPN